MEVDDNEEEGYIPQEYELTSKCHTAFNYTLSLHPAVL
jgi:hypothetical protein